MAVVTKYGPGYKDPNALRAAPSIFAAGEVISINGNVSIANGDSANSLIYFGKIPSIARPLPQSLITHAALGGTCAFHLGVNGSAQLFAASQACAAAGTKNGLASVLTADLGKRLWELLGLTSDPGREYELILTLSVAAAAAGDINMSFLYST